MRLIVFVIGIVIASASFASSQFEMTSSDGTVLKLKPCPFQPNSKLVTRDGKIGCWKLSGNMVEITWLDKQEFMFQVDFKPKESKVK